MTDLDRARELYRGALDIALVMSDDHPDYKSVTLRLREHAETIARLSGAMAAHLNPSK